MKFAGDTNLRPAVTTGNDWNTSWKELDESAEKRSYMQFNRRNAKLCP